jgi:iron(III) transport system substrate-binding protein
MAWRLVVLLSIAASASPGLAQDTVVNVYSARHYQADGALYQEFTSRTGIRVNRVDDKEDELLERIRNEGASGPADVFITVDAARLGRADELGLFAPIQSSVLEERIPANLRTTTWLNPRLKGKVCVRSGSHPYNLSLGAALISHLGEERTERWAKGLVANFARPPKGGDTDQIRSVASGECQVALANSYYVARLMRSDEPWDRDVVSRIGVVWPNQRKQGTHVNVSGGGVLKTAPHKRAAVMFLEYLTSDEAQIHFAEGDNEWPVVKTAKTANPALVSLGTFRSDPLNIGTLSKHAARAREILERAGWR